MPRHLDHPVRVLRLRARLSLAQLARKAEVDMSSLAALEEGRTRMPTGVTLRAMASALGVTPETIESSLTVWNEKLEQKPAELSAVARIVLQMTPEEVVRTFATFTAWRSQIAPTPTAFASMLGVNRATVARYEQGSKVKHGLPAPMASAVLRVLGVDEKYLFALEELPTPEVTA